MSQAQRLSAAPTGSMFEHFSHSDLRFRCVLPASRPDQQAYRFLEGRR